METRRQIEALVKTYLQTVQGMRKQQTEGGAEPPIGEQEPVDTGVLLSAMAELKETLTNFQTLTQSTLSGLTDETARAQLKQSLLTFLTDAITTLTQMKDDLTQTA